MDAQKAILILNPETMIQTLEEIKYYHGFKGEEAANEQIKAALFLACDIMREHLEREQGCLYCSDQYTEGHKELCRGDSCAPISAEVYYVEPIMGNECPGQPMLSMNVDILAEERGVGVGGTSVEINYCPICGRNLPIKDWFEKGE